MTNPKKYVAVVENKHFVGYLLLKILRKEREREGGERIWEWETEKRERKTEREREF